jgi:hypothetical protein
MNAEVEDQIRAAIRAKAETLREVQPLRLPPEPGGQPGPGSGTQPRRARRLRPWIVPVTAAAAVIALAISLVLVRDIPNGRGVPPSGPATVAGGVPRYYVTLYSPSKSAANQLLVGDTFTGAKVAVVPPPRGATFDGIAAAADDRTFVVDTQSHPGVSDSLLPRTWFLLRIAPGTSSPAQLTKLPLPPLTGIEAIALSGSGRQFAVATQGAFNAATQSPGEYQIRIYSVDSGKLLHTWSTNKAGALDPGYFAEQSRALAWIDGDRAVAFSVSGSVQLPGLAKALQQLNKETGLSSTERLRRELALRSRYLHLVMTWRRLDISTGDGDLMADSKVIWSQTLSPFQEHSNACQPGWIQGISADGKTLVCGSLSVTQGTQSKPTSWRVAWLAYSVRTGAVRTLYQVIVHKAAPPYVYPLWAGTSGNTIIGKWGQETSSGLQHNPPVGVISNGTFKQIPSPPDAGAMAPSVTW